jgi:hypothetical protein
MLKFKHIFILSLIAFSSHAQVAGYEGKRCVVGYSNYFMLGFKGPGAHTASPKDEFSLAFNNVHCLNIDYAFKQRQMVCIEAQYLKTGIAYEKTTSTNSAFDFGLSDYHYPYDVKYGGDFSMPASLTSINFGLGLKTFKRGFLAPVGRYNKLEFLFMLETVTYKNTQFLKKNNDNYPYTYDPFTAGEGTYKYKNFAIVYSIGRQRVLFNKLVLDYGIRFAYTPSINVVSIIVADNADKNDMENYYRNASRNRVFREQLLNFHIGIGFLAF